MRHQDLMNEGEWAIQAQKVTKAFGSHLAVRDLDLTVPTGSIFGFIGPNGSGKTTTIRMLLGLLRPSSGEIRLLGRFDRSGIHRARKHIGATVETPTFYPNLSARQNLGLYCTIRELEDVDPEPILDLVGLAYDADRLVREFSLGMTQRLALATALVGAPSLLVLDEPTNGLDPQGIRDLGRAIKGIQERGTTVFLSSHILQEVQRLCSHICVIMGGRLRFSGRVEDMIGSGTVVKLRAEDLEALGSALSICALVDSWTEKRGYCVAHLSHPDLTGLSKFLSERGVFPTHFSPLRSDLESAFFLLTEQDGDGHKVDDGLCD